MATSSDEDDTDNPYEDFFDNWFNDDDKPFLSDGPWNDYDKNEIQGKLQLTAKSMADIKAFYNGEYTDQSKKMLGATPRFVVVDPEESPFYWSKKDAGFDLRIDVGGINNIRIEKPVAGYSVDVQLKIEHDEFDVIWGSGQYCAKNLNDIPELAEKAFTNDDLKNFYWELQPSAENYYNLMYNGVCVGELEYLTAYTDKYGELYEPAVQVYLENLKSLLIYMAPQSD